MKTLLGSLVVVFSITAVQTSTSFAQSGWFWQSPVPRGDAHLNSIAALDPQTAVAVGDGGNIVRTINGGWALLSSGTTNSLYGVSLVDANTATVVGAGGTILRTTDGR